MKVTHTQIIGGIPHYRLECGHTNTAPGRRGEAAPKVGQAWPCKRCTPDAEMVMRAIAEKVPPLARDVTVIPTRDGIRRQIRDVTVGFESAGFRVDDEP